MFNQYSMVNSGEAGYQRLTIGVEAHMTRNLGIYLHWGYDEFQADFCFRIIILILSVALEHIALFQDIFPVLQIQKGGSHGKVF